MMNYASKMVESTVVKKDTEVCRLRIRRSRKGIAVNVKVDEVLESLFKDWAQQGIPHNPQHGRFWESVEGPLPGLYPLGLLPEGGGVLRASNGKMYRIDRTGTALEEDNVLNIGFLRFVGASGNDGVNFVVKGVYSTEAIRKLAQDLQQAIKHFFINFVKPIDVVVHLTTQEV